jgi:hypothetical protein
MHSRSSKPVLLLGLLGCSLLLFFSSRITMAQGGTASHSPRWCWQCHPEAYEKWALSSHDTTFHSDTFQMLWERERHTEECLSCHTTGYEADTRTIGYEGVGCAACHAPVGNNHDFDPETRAHEELSIPGLPVDCAGCHGADHALTYLEWEQSAHNGAREVGCQECHDAHSARLVEEDIVIGCGSCHLQPVPVTSPHMFIDSGCTDCHPAPISTSNVHMNDNEGVIADCVACHMITETDRRDRYLTNAGHNMTVSLTACTTCHGDLHNLQQNKMPSEGE